MYTSVHGDQTCHRLSTKRGQYHYDAAASSDPFKGCADHGTLRPSLHQRTRHAVDGGTFNDQYSLSRSIQKFVLELFQALSHVIGLFPKFHGKLKVFPSQSLQLVNFLFYIIGTHIYYTWHSD